MRSSEAFSQPLAKAASRSHDAAVHFQSLFREKMIEIDSEMRARGLFDVKSKGILQLPHVCSDTRSKSKKRTKPGYERRVRRKPASLRSRELAKAKAISSSSASSSSAADIDLPEYDLPDVLSSSDDEVSLGSMSNTLKPGVQLVEDSKHGTAPVLNC